MFRFAWRPPIDEGGALDARPRFPRSCRVEDALLACADLSGSIAIEGLSDPRLRVVVSIRRLDGTHTERIVSSADPRVGWQAHDGSSMAWLRLGAEHVLTGVDHLAFVVGLLLVTGLRRRIVITVTAFTLAHSVTLALAVLDVVRVPPAPVEATIAASIVLVAREALRAPADATWTRRAPWAVALVFGLVHGLGFAGALERSGLPRESLGRALLLFNAGVEIGQLAVVAVAVGAALLVRRWSEPGTSEPSPRPSTAHERSTSGPQRPERTLSERARSERAQSAARASAYALGSLGAFWLVARTIAIVTGSS